MEYERKGCEGYAPQVVSLFNRDSRNKAPLRCVPCNANDAFTITTPPKYYVRHLGIAGKQLYR